LTINREKKLAKNPVLHILASDSIYEVPMLYNLPNGRSVELSDVRRISKVRDQGDDMSTIGYRKMVFTIHMNNRDIVEVSEQYHYSDWMDKKKELNNVRADLVSKWKALTGGIDS